MTIHHDAAATEWHKYKLQAFDVADEPCTPPCVVEAPSPGVAIEFFLAVHGMLSYCKIRLGKTDEAPDEDRTEVMKFLPEMKSPTELDSWHKWEPWDADSP